MSNVVALALPAPVPNILLIEDSPSDALLIKKIIVKTMRGDCTIRHENTLEAALKALSEADYDVALLDLSLPDSADFDGLLSIQNFAPKLPVVILTAYADEEVALKAVEHGAQDYLFKDKVDGKSIHRAMQYAVQRKQFESTLITQANFDTLTGLANRQLFESRLDMALARIKRSGSGLGVFFLDLNRFKQVNDLLGHAAGDKLLAQVAERLGQCIRPYDTAARFGGDEFALLVEGIAHARDCAVIAQKILSRMAEPFTVNRKKLDVGVSIGIATAFAEEKINRPALMQHADEAMYGVKLSQRSNYHFYTQAIHEETVARLKLEEELRVAFAFDELTLHYQPKIDLHSGETAGAEALLRWNHPTRGLLLPAEFVAIAEETGMAKELGEWVLSAVCGDMARWQKSGLAPMQVSVNISTAQLDDDDFTGFLQVLLKQYDIHAEQLVLEISSSAILEQSVKRIKTLTAINDMGIRIHLDHFGASAISLASLEALYVDAVKIAPELAGVIDQSNGMLMMVQAIIDIAKRFDVKVMVAGIENDWQRAFFKERGCSEGQGFALCRPVPADYIPDWHSKKNN